MTDQPNLKKRPDLLNPALPSYRLLAELGFLGARFGYHRQAHLIFQALLTLKPGSSIALYGLATDALYRNQSSEALAILEKALAGQVEDRVQIEGLYGFILLMAGHRAQGQALAKKLKKGTLDAPLKRLLDLCAN